MGMNYRDMLLKFRREASGEVGEERVEIPSLRRFHLNRSEDETGVSGTGVVAVGIQFPSGQCVMEWISKRTKAKSMGVYQSPEDLIEVHGHDGRTTMEWLDD